MSIPLYTGTVPALNQTQPNFDTNTQNFIDYIASLAPEINTFAESLNTLDTTSTSTSSVLIGTGSKTFTVQTGKSYFLGMSLKIANSATNYMVGEIISYNTSTGALVVNVVAVSGTGTYASWTITVAVNSIVSTAQIADGAVTNSKLANNVYSDLTSVTFDPNADFVVIADTSDLGAKKKAYIPVGTDTIKGLVEFSTDSEVRTGTSTSLAVTPANMRATLIALGQTWTNVTASRVKGTTYTNTTGRPIYVSISMSAGGGTTTNTLTINGIVVSTISGDDNYNPAQTLTGIVQNNETYVVSTGGSSVSVWAELR